MQDKFSKINNVAIYLRKSRDDGEYDDVLSKHREHLMEIADSKAWTYTLYEEIGSGETIAKWQKMQELLKDVSDRKYHGVMVMDVDRLGRGEYRDWATIRETFIDSNTYIITPQKNYDLSEDTDEMIFDFQTLIAKQEYKMIKKRLRQGKVDGAKKGMWTNGTAPYPYVYNPRKKQLEVDEDRRKIYRLILDKYILERMSCQQIAIWLNQEHVAPPYPSHRNKNGWSDHTVHRILTSEIHLGYIIYGRTKKTRTGYEVVGEDQWIKMRGNHEALKTEGEHELILSYMRQNELFPTKARNGAIPLSGLLFCAKCGHRMQFKRRIYNGVVTWSAMCVYTYPDGRKCEQVGRKLDDEFYDALYRQVLKLDARFLATNSSNKNHRRQVESIIAAKQAELEHIDQMARKVNLMYEEGDITREYYRERIERHYRARVEIEAQVDHYETMLEILDANEPGKIKLRIDQFRGAWEKATSSVEKNRAFKLLINKIAYDRNEDKSVTLRVSYR